jgi:hypothetical protein
MYIGLGNASFGFGDVTKKEKQGVPAPAWQVGTVHQRRSLMATGGEFPKQA